MGFDFSETLCLVRSLELELIQIQIAQKLTLRAEVYARAYGYFRTYTKGRSPIHPEALSKIPTKAASRAESSLV
jgi:hypothetical protein